MAKTEKTDAVKIATAWRHSVQGTDENTEGQKQQSKQDRNKSRPRLPKCSERKNAALPNHYNGEESKHGPREPVGCHSGADSSKRSSRLPENLWNFKKAGALS